MKNPPARFCRLCGRPVPPHNRPGRPPIWCSETCRWRGNHAPGPVADDLPPEMAALVVGADELLEMLR